MSQNLLQALMGQRITLPGHFESPVTLEDARALGRDGSAGYECRVRLPDGTLVERVISPDEAAALAGTRIELSGAARLDHAKRVIVAARFEIPADAIAGAATAGGA